MHFNNCHVFHPKPCVVCWSLRLDEPFLPDHTRNGSRAGEDLLQSSAKPKVMRQEDIQDTTSTFSSSLQSSCCVQAEWEHTWNCPGHKPTVGSTDRFLDLAAKHIPHHLEPVAWNSLHHSLRHCRDAPLGCTRSEAERRHPGLSADKSQGQSAGRAHPI